MGVARGSLITLNESTKEEILSRNPALGSKPWATLPEDQTKHYRPYPIIGVSILGPVLGSALGIDTPYCMYEVSPLYIGRPFTSYFTYTMAGGVITLPFLIGGLKLPNPDPDANPNPDPDPDVNPNINSDP